MAEDEVEVRKPEPVYTRKERVIEIPSLRSRFLPTPERYGQGDKPGQIDPPRRS